MSNSSPEIERARAAIDLELARLRDSDESPDELVADLHERFAVYEPQSAEAGSRLRRTLSWMDAVVGLDDAVPLGSRIPGGALVKRVLHRLIGWYVRFFVGQVARSVWALARVLHSVVDEIEALERHGSPVAVSGPGGSLQGGGEGSWWAPLVAGAFDRSDASVLEESEGAADIEGRLRACTPRSLAGVLVSASASQGPVGARVRLVDLARSRLSDGAIFALVSRTPQAWARSASPADDFVASRPFHAQSWVQLLERAGFADVEVHRGGPDRRVRPDLQGTGDGAKGDGAVVRALVDTVNSMVGGPDEYLVMGRRR